MDHTFRLFGYKDIQRFGVLQVKYEINMREISVIGIGPLSAIGVPLQYLALRSCLQHYIRGFRVNNMF